MCRDALLKSLLRNLADLIRPSDLRSWGWWDFVDFDHEGTTAPTLAAEALMYLGLDQGDWRATPTLVKSVLTFVLEHGGRQPTGNELTELRALLDSADREAIGTWFARLF